MYQICADGIFGASVNRVVIGNLVETNRQAFEDKLLEDGVHVIAHCFGIADVVVMDALGLNHVNVYVQPPP
jgi:hypothetical protein